MSMDVGLGTISLTAAFLAGIVALFAPCCISYLLPAYFGSVFKERKRILWMTMVYSLGIATIMLPVVIGVKLVSMLLFDLHDTTYLAGGIFMLIIAAMSLLGIKLPMPRFSKTTSGETDPISIYMLGVFSGITSSCCAPVLAGVLTLSSLSISLIGAVSIGFVYVLGMVAPLYLASLFIQKRNILERPILKKTVTTLRFLNKEFVISVNNLFSAAIFFFAGTAMIGLTLAGKLGMSAENDAAGKSIASFATKATLTLNQIPGVDIILLILLGFAMIMIIRETRKATPKNRSE